MKKVKQRTARSTLLNVRALTTDGMPRQVSVLVTDRNSIVKRTPHVSLRKQCKR